MIQWWRKNVCGVVIKGMNWDDEHTVTSLHLNLLPNEECINTSLSVPAHSNRLHSGPIGYTFCVSRGTHDHQVMLCCTSHTLT